MAAIAGRLAHRPLLVMLDVDGTLAPIAPRPEEARVPEETRRHLAALVAAPDTHVAVVSGRAAADSARLVGVSGIWVLGNHGMEIGSPDGSLEADPGVVPWEPAIAMAAGELARIASAATGVIVENKRWTLSVHYRLAAGDAVPRLVELVRGIAAAGGLRLTEGKKVLELRPPVSVNKGTAAVALADRLGAFRQSSSVLFAGDDRTDEDAFRELRARKPETVTIVIGEEPRGDTAAEFALGTPGDMGELLGWLAGGALPGA